MKQYPSIDKRIQPLHIVAFDKIDGSNIRAEWNPKKGFYKFGSRKELIGPDNEPLGRSIEIIKSKYEKDLSDVLKGLKTERAICFFEFHGPSSAFGQHKPDEEQDLSLIDVSLFKKGILPPKDFLKYFGHVNHAPVLYEGKPTQEFVDSVINSTLEGMTEEGVVCKGPFDKSLGGPIMFKIKSDAWIKRLRNYCSGYDELFETLL